MECERSYGWNLLLRHAILFGIYINENRFLGFIRLMNVTHIHLTEVDSTNTYLKRHFEEFPDATLLSTDSQTAGRGRLDRKWLSPPGENVCASFLMKSPEKPFDGTMVASLSVLRTLREFAPGQHFYIKWPNDIYVETAKIAGVLSECVAVSGGIVAVISGMGININSRAESFEPLEYPASSLRILEGHAFDLDFFIVRLAENLKQCYITGITDIGELAGLWKDENLLIGRTLDFISLDGETFRSKFLDVNEAGEAVIEGKDGHPMIFSCGDVTVLKESIGDLFDKQKP